MTQAPATPELVERLKAMASMPFTRFHYTDDAVMVKQAAAALEAQQARIAELEAALRAQDDAERRDEQHQELIAQSVGEGWDEVTGGSHLDADWKHVSAAYAKARELRVQALSSQGRHEGVTSGFIPELPGVNAVPLPASPDGPSQMDRVWAAVNVLGAPDTACTSDEDRAYCRAIGDALSEIEKLGGRPQ